jgi:Zn-dependent M16 (insulinase) family peptidase
MIKIGEYIHGFCLEKRKRVEELDGDCLLFRHEKSGARLLKVICQDDNKVFAVTFKTPPPDDSGLPHILEHSVLNGSERFPVKSPFDVLSQGSLKTFLNAMTGSDMTIYPVASRNDKDFFNLMHVYLDAVFRPLIYRDGRILKQEGWHYELESVDAPLTYTGVVYNEMKGAFSAPQRVLDLLIGRALFPDNCYSRSSGGVPEAIPTINQERFESFHQTYYHPSNSYIYLYGNGEMERELAFIDEQYLDGYEKKAVLSDIPLQPAPKQVGDIGDIHGVYALPQGASLDGQTYLSWAGVWGRNTDQESGIALEILAEALVNHESGPLRQALKLAEIGQDVSAYVDKIQQPVLQILVSNAKAGDLERFKTVFTDTLRQVCSQGLDRIMIEGIINRMEFSLREGQGSFTGVSGAMMATPGWLFGDDPFSTLSFGRELSALREKIDSHYLEGLVGQVMVQNPHACFGALDPREGLEGETAAETALELARIKNGLSQAQIAELVRETLELRAFQQREDAPEDLQTIPLLELSDLDSQDQVIETRQETLDGVELLQLEEFTRGIVYLSLYFDASGLEQALIPYLQLFNQLIGLLNTSAYDYGELEDQINLHTGGISSSLNPLLLRRDDSCLLPLFVFKGKVMPEKSERLLELMAEQLLNTDWSGDPARLKMLIQRLRAQTEQGLPYNGLNIATLRLSSYFSRRGMYRELTMGHSYYQFLCELADHFDTRRDAIVNRLKAVGKAVLNQKSLLISLTGLPEHIAPMKQMLSDFIRRLPPGLEEPKTYSFPLVSANEGFKDASKVMYVAQGYDFSKLGYAYTGQMDVLSQLLSTVYLQNTVRVMGGAYGGFAMISDYGSLILASYRDPNLEKTLQIYCQTPLFLENLQLSERDLRRLIIGTISRRDYPRTPAQKASVAVERHLTRMTPDKLQSERTQILSVTLNELRALADMVGKVMDQGAICVVGNENKIEEQRDLFRQTLSLRR